MLARADALLLYLENRDAAGGFTSVGKVYSANIQRERAPRGRAELAIPPGKPLFIGFPGAFNNLLTKPLI